MGGVASDPGRAAAPADPARDAAPDLALARRRSSRRVAVVPHTHWDREWYRSFPAFRLLLVEMLDGFLPRFETDTSYPRFLLDGQMAVVDDYLEVRPEERPRLERLARSRRLTVGPWYVLMDEFLVSGETIVRNLQLGLERAEAFGGAMPVGYLPDMFGHVAQMPQILRQAGLEHAVVWRGVPSAIGQTAFWWAAPDGSTVRAEYLPVGYANGARLPDDAGALIRRVAAHELELGPLLGEDDRPLLLMNGTDHEVPQPWLGRVVAEANRAQEAFCLEITSLPAYLSSAPVEGLPSWAGELRSGARANLLMGVASNRVDVRKAARAAEQALEREAEPLCALWLPPGEWPDAELRVAWAEVISNSAHDSICACSIDQVGLSVLARFAQATSAAEGLRDRAMSLAGTTMSASGPVVLNSSARTRSGIVELILPGAEPVPGTQVVSQVQRGMGEATGTGTELGAMLGKLAADGYQTSTAVVGARLDAGQDGVDLLIHTGSGQATSAEARQVMAEAWAQAGAHRDQPFRLRVQRDPWQRVLAHIADVPGFGWRAWQPGTATPAPVSVEQWHLDNGLMRLEVDVDNGTFSVNGLPGFHRLIDGGDEGDTYNYSPPAADAEVDVPLSVQVETLAPGPLQGALRITRTYCWPAAVEGGRRVGEEQVRVVTDLELRAGEGLARVTTTFDNRCRDHRLRAWLPLPRRAESSRAECAFAVVERGLHAEGRPQEVGIPTFPSQRFVIAGGLTVVHDRVLEYEVVDEGRGLALTLLRATGMLSRPHPAYRPNSAGPAIPVEGPQLQGRLQVRYAIHLGDEDPYALADQAWLALGVTTGSGNGWRPAAGSLLEVHGAEVSAVRRVDGELEVRVFNPTDGPTTVSLGGRAGRLVDLRGRARQGFDDDFTLKPWELATARLAEAGR